jgi:hypothetical protein
MNLSMQVSSFNKLWFTPVIGSLMNRRSESWIISAAVMAQVGLTLAHLPGWQCPIKAATGIPCPGCGLSTACSMLLKGEWQESFKTHAFAPFFIAGILMITVVSLLPEPIRLKVAQKTSSFESRTGIMAWFLLSLLLYWGLRLVQLV